MLPPPKTTKGSWYKMHLAFAKQLSKVVIEPDYDAWNKQLSEAYAKANKNATAFEVRYILAQVDATLSQYQPRKPFEAKIKREAERAVACLKQRMRNHPTQREVNTCYHQAKILLKSWRGRLRKR